MHPALSVIFFTTLSGAGYGLLAWSALAALGGRVPGWPLLLGLATGLGLVTAGLVSSLFHLGQPRRAWRAFSQWRTSWLSREGVLALLTYLPALALAAMLWGDAAAPAHPGPGPAPRAGLWAAALLTMAGALTTVVCTAMIYASLKPIPAWRHRLVVPGYLLFALLTGGLLLAAIEAVDGSRLENGPALAAMVLALALWRLKRRYWRDLDAPLPATRGDAVGLPGRVVTPFERPHTEANYVTREMAFALARRHAQRLRRLAVLLFAAVPVLLMLPVWIFVHLDAAPWYAAAALGALAGAFVERWLFFAEARHVVTLYY